MIYLRLAAVAAVAVIVGIALWYRGEAIAAKSARDVANAALGQAVAVNERMAATIDRIEEAQRRNNALVSTLATRVDSINKAALETRDAIGELEKVNDDVRAFLAVSVPDDLRRLLNNRAGSEGNANSRGNPARTDVAPVRPPVSGN